MARAEVPAGGPAGGSGPRVQAMTAPCTGAYHLSKRTIQNVMEDLFGVAMGLGTVAKLEQATAQAGAEPLAEARAYVPTQTGRVAQRDGLARRSAAVLVMGRRHRVGHRVCDPTVAQSHNGPRALGRAV
jgi:hypothetical protein